MNLNYFMVLRTEKHKSWDKLHTFLGIFNYKTKGDFPIKYKHKYKT